KNFDEDPLLIDATAKALIDMYPRVIVTPHIGSNTDEAVSNMVETSFDNLYKMFHQLDCANTLSV
ncbi:lactate dehydrogenase, partial [Enterococcus mundtii]|nr:lactate dehydrogenase [Enterococcus mundtii]